MKISSYRDLKAWQIGMDVVETVYSVTRSFPKHELYGLSGQMQRAAISIPANLAEGHARDSLKEFLHHVAIALGSLAELETQLILAQRLRYLESDNATGLLSQLDELGKVIRGLQKSLKSRLARS